MRSLVLGTIEAALGVYYALALQNIKDFRRNPLGFVSLSQFQNCQANFQRPGGGLFRIENFGRSRAPSVASEQACEL